MFLKQDVNTVLSLKPSSYWIPSLLSKDLFPLGAEWRESQMSCVATFPKFTPYSRLFLRPALPGYVKRIPQLLHLINVRFQNILVALRHSAGRSQATPGNVPLLKTALYDFSLRFFLYVNNNKILILYLILQHYSLVMIIYWLARR